MRRFASFLLCALLAGGGCTSEAPAPPADSSSPKGSGRFTLAFTGNVGGVIDPCGCVKNELGGLARRGTILAGLRKDHPNLLYVDNGNLLFPMGEVQEIERGQKIAKAGLLIDASNYLGLAGFSPSRNDFAAGKEALLELLSNAQFPVVSANLFDPEKQDYLFSRSTIVEAGQVRLGVTGVTGDFVGENALLKDKLEVRDPVAALKEVLPELSQKSDRVLVLSTLEGEGRLAVAALEGVDYVLGWPGDPGTSHVRPARNALVGAASDRGRHVGVLSLSVEPGRLGYLAAQESETLRRRAAEIEEKLAAPAESKESSQELESERARIRELLEFQGQKNTYAAQMIPVAEEIKPEEHLFVEVDAFRRREEVEALTIYGNNWREYSQERGPYAGAGTCRTCHTAQYDNWLVTGHAHAFETLAKTHQSADMTCIKCHNMGFQLLGGFATAYVPPFFRNVQCESCHGPAGEHVRNPVGTRPKWEPNENRCRICHGTKHGEKFTFAERLPAVTCPDTDLKKKRLLRESVLPPGKK